MQHGQTGDPPEPGSLTYKQMFTSQGMAMNIPHVAFLQPVQSGDGSTRLEVKWLPPEGARRLGRRRLSQRLNHAHIGGKSVPEWQAAAKAQARQYMQQPQAHQQQRVPHPGEKPVRT